MAEIVAAVQSVTDIMSEISAASQEQSAGIEQVNRTITHMGEATQQNAALIEEANAAARSMEKQAHRLSEAVSIFNLDAPALPTNKRRDQAHSTPHQPGKLTEKLKVIASASAFRT